MSFKSFSDTHKTPAGNKAAVGKQAPLVDQPPAPPAKADAAAKPANKP